jgi:V8-like Glu-specific endopeptidase
MFKIISLLAFLPSLALAFPKAPFNALEVEINRNQKNVSQYDFEAIVKLSNCSGSVIRFAGQPVTAKAYVLTNGHCLGGGFLKPGEVRSHQRLSRTMRVFDRSMNLFTINATKLSYATMTDTDLALYEINLTYQDLLDKGIEALTYSENRPLIGTGIDIVSGYWDRGYRCYIDGFVFQLKEDAWTFTDSIRYSSSGCNTIGGTSGSPIIETGTRNVIGVNNTGNESGRRCTMNNPCEVDENGNIEVRPKASYGQQTFHVYSCLSVDFQIDLTREGCNLPK